MKKRLIWLLLPGLIGHDAAAAGMMAGGYSPADPKQPEIIKAAQFAVQSKNALPESKPVALVKIRKAEQQVVAGMNYRMCLSVKDRRHAFRTLVVVYNDLSGKMILTEWTPGGC